MLFTVHRDARNFTNLPWYKVPPSKPDIFHEFREGREVDDGRRWVEMGKWLQKMEN